MPAEIAATWPVRGRRLSLLSRTSPMSASCSATHAPVMDAVRVPPSAWITSQSMVTVTSPSFSMRTTLRRLRPMRRAISMLRPLRAPYSRFDLRAVECLDAPTGQPEVVMNGALAKTYASAGVSSILVSVTNETGYVEAIALAQ